MLMLVDDDDDEACPAQSCEPQFSLTDATEPEPKEKESERER